MNIDSTKSDSSNQDIEIEKVKCLIIGSGPAGYTAAIYAARANLSPVMYEGLEPGGQLTTTTDVENFPGYPKGITGPEMMEELKAQAIRFGTDVRWGLATKVDFSGPPHKVWIDDKKMVESDVVILATGATAKYLGIEDEKKYAGSGVSACATCDGFFYRGKDVAVVGGDAQQAAHVADAEAVCVFKAEGGSGARNVGGEGGDLIEVWQVDAAGGNNLQGTCGDRTAVLGDAAGTCGEGHHPGGVGAVRQCKIGIEED